MKVEKFKMADPRWPPFGNHEVIITSYDFKRSLLGTSKERLRTCYQSSKSHCPSFYTCEVIEGAGGGGLNIYRCIKKVFR